MEASGYGTTVGLLAPYTVGRGYSQLIRVASPAAGAGFSYRANQGATENVRAVRFQLVTSAAVASRVPRIELQDGDGLPVVAVQETTGQAASITHGYTFVVGIGVLMVGAGAVDVLPLPDLFMPDGTSWVVTVGAMDAADQISGIQVISEIFPIGPGGEPQGTYSTAQP